MTSSGKDMKLKVSLYGTLSQKVPGYEHSKGIEVELPAGATVDDLLARLGIEPSQSPVVTADGRIRRGDEKIAEGGWIRIFQPIHGG